MNSVEQEDDAESSELCDGVDLLSHIFLNHSDKVVVLVHEGCVLLLGKLLCLLSVELADIRDQLGDFELNCLGSVVVLYARVVRWRDRRKVTFKSFSIFLRAVLEVFLERHLVRREAIVRPG